MIYLDRNATTPRRPEALEAMLPYLRERQGNPSSPHRAGHEARLLAAVDGVRVNGAGAPRVPNTSSLSFRGVDGESIVLGLDVRGICVSTGSACSTGDPEPSRVLLAMGLSPRAAQGSTRISLGRATTREQVDATAAARGTEPAGPLPDGADVPDGRTGRDGAHGREPGAGRGVKGGV